MITNQQMIKDLTYSANKIKKAIAQNNDYKTYTQYLSTDTTAEQLKTIFTKQQLENIYKAYHIINQAKYKLATAKPTRSQKLNNAYGKEDKHPSEYTQPETKQKTQPHKTNNNIQSIKPKDTYTGKQLQYINPCKLNTLGIEFQQEYYNQIKDLKHLLKDTSTYKVEYISHYLPDENQTETYYEIKEIK